MDIKAIMTSAIAVLVVMGVIALHALGHNVPTELWTGFGVIIGFFFGSSIGPNPAK